MMQKHKADHFQKAAMATGQNAGPTIVKIQKEMIDGNYREAR